MEEDCSHLTKRILDLTLEVISLLTRETFTVVMSGECVTIMAPQHHFVIPKRTNKQKILELINKMVELLTGESGFPSRCDSRDKGEREEECGEDGGMTGLHSEEHKAAMMEDQQSDGARCPHLLYSQDATLEAQETPQQHQGDRLTEIKVEEPTMRGDQSSAKQAGMMVTEKEEEETVVISDQGSIKDKIKLTIKEEEGRSTGRTGQRFTEEAGMRLTMKEEGEASVWGDWRPREEVEMRFKEEEPWERNGEGSREQVGMRVTMKEEEEPSVWGDETTREVRVMSAIKEEAMDRSGEGSAERAGVTLTCNEDDEALRPVLPSLEDVGMNIKQGDMFWAAASDYGCDLSMTSEGRSTVSPECEPEEGTAPALLGGLQRSPVHSKGSSVNIPTYVTGDRGETLSVCQDCGECFTSRAKYHSHRRVHSKKRPLSEECKSEDDDITRKSDVHLGPHRAERSLEHADPEGSPPEIVTPAGDTLSVCQDCGECFTSRAQYHTHRKLHLENRLFPCSECGKSFKRKIDLVNHLDSHKLERPFSCPDCGKTFPNKAKLTVHQRSHMRKTILSCPECRKQFTMKSQLNRHRKRHSGDKPFSCTKCTYRSAYKCDLALHLRFHTE